jgi:hypothetical protein
MSRRNAAVSPALAANAVSSRVGITPSMARGAGRFVPGEVAMAREAGADRTAAPSHANQRRYRRRVSAPAVPLGPVRPVALVDTAYLLSAIADTTRSSQDARRHHHELWRTWAASPRW